MVSYFYIPSAITFYQLINKNLNALFSNYESEKLRGIEEPRPWSVQKEMAHHCQPHYHALDVSCGTLFKWEALKNRVKTLTRLDRNPNIFSHNIRAEC